MSVRVVGNCHAATLTRHGGGCRSDSQPATHVAVAPTSFVDKPPLMTWHSAWTHSAGLALSLLVLLLLLLLLLLMPPPPLLLLCAQVRVLTTGFWPLYPMMKINVPAEMQQCMQVRVVAGTPTASTSPPPHMLSQL